MIGVTRMAKITKEKVEKTASSVKRLEDMKLKFKEDKEMYERRLAVIVSKVKKCKVKKNTPEENAEAVANLVEEIIDDIEEEHGEMFSERLEQLRTEEEISHKV